MRIYHKGAAADHRIFRLEAGHQLAAATGLKAVMNRLQDIDIRCARLRNYRNRGISREQKAAVANNAKDRNGTPMREHAGTAREQQKIKTAENPTLSAD